MRKYSLAMAAAILAFSGTAAFAQQDSRDGTTTQFNAHDQQVTQDWYKQHQNNPPVGLRSRDRLSADRESRFKEGAVLDKGMRKEVHPAPPELTRQLSPPPSHNRYVAIGGHIGLIDSNYHVKAVIHLHDN